jgi:crossover junction endonuclease MUS81
MEKARGERHGPDQHGCKNPQNLEYTLFFYYMMESHNERSPLGADAQWSKSLYKIVGSLRKLPSRVRSLEHANAIHGVGPKTLELFRKYLTAYPPDPPSDAELLADERAAEATRVAKEADKARKKAEREAKKRATAANETANAAKTVFPNATPDAARDALGNDERARRRYDPRGSEDDIIAIDLDSPLQNPAPRNRENVREDTARDASRPPAKRAKKGKEKTQKPSRWEPGYRTAPFALLVTLHKLHLRDENAVSKKRLMDLAEQSDLSAQGIYPKGDDAQGHGRGGGAANYRGEPGAQRFAYSGWSCFNKQLAKAPKGWSAPMVMTWSNPIQIRLTDEGKMLGSWLHAAAETRGDCACGLMAERDVQRAEAERRRIMFGDRGEGDHGFEGDQSRTDTPREGDRGASSSGTHAGMRVSSAAASTRRSATARPDATLKAAFVAPESSEPVRDAALRLERARAATLEEIARVRASARAEASAANASTTPGAQAAAAAERRRVSVSMPSSGSPPDDVVVVLDDDDVDVDERDLPRAVSGCTRDEAGVPQIREVRVNPVNPKNHVNDLDGSPRTDSTVAASPSRHRSRTHPATASGGRRAPRLPPIPFGETFADAYDVVLIVDNREQFGAGRRAVGQNRSEHRHEEVARIASAHGVNAEVGHLECGDATWVARRKRGRNVFVTPDANDARSGFPVPDDYVLDFVVERKSLEDLKISIQDDRYRQQKFFLKRSGLRALGYLVEGDVGKFAERPDISEQSVKAVGSAAVQTEIWDGFRVIRTEHVKETFDVLARMTTAIRDRYAPLRREDGAEAKRDASVRAAEGAAACAERATPLTLEEYNSNLSREKRSLSTLRNVWGSMLMSVSGLGPENAQAIVDLFPTPSSLHAAYALMDSPESASLLLASTRVSEHRTIGPVLSKRVYASLFGNQLTPLA